MASRLTVLGSMLIFSAGAIAAEGFETQGAARLWLPDLVSTAQAEVRLTFSPDGKRMLWGAIGWNGGAGGWDIYQSERSAAGWSPPQPVSFNSSVNDFDPSFAPDASGVYFFSNRPGGHGKDDLYFVAFDAGTGHYGVAKNLGAEINTPGDEWAPVVAPNGKRLLFASDGRGGKGKHDLFIAHRVAGEWAKVENLTAVNTPEDDFDGTFLHDGESIIYASGNMDGAVVLYVAQFSDGRWRPRVRLPEAINSTQPDAWTFGPSISAHDSDALYFTSRHADNRGRADIYRIEYQLVSPR
jgi:TolB protein